MTIDPASIALDWSLSLDAGIVTRLRRWIGKIEPNGPTLADLVALTIGDLHDIRGMGPISVRAVVSMLTDYGLALRQADKTTYELPLCPSERLRLKRFGEWIRESDSNITLSTALHEFLIEEARKRR